MKARSDYALCSRGWGHPRAFPTGGAHAPARASSTSLRHDLHGAVLLEVHEGLPLVHEEGLEAASVLDADEAEPTLDEAPRLVEVCDGSTARAVLALLQEVVEEGA